jgi:hypothetical protein
MTDAPEQLWVWHHSGKWGEANVRNGETLGHGHYFGIGRETNLFPLDEKERNSGAIYVRADLVEKLKG